MSNELLKKEIILDRDTVTMYYYPNEKIIHHVLHKFIYGDDFKDFLMKGADYFEKYKCNKWLSDDRKSSALRRVDIEWSEANWRDRIIELGWKYWAIIMPDKAAGKHATKLAIEQFIKKDLKIEIFENESDALDWLIKCQ